MLIDHLHGMFDKEIRSEKNLRCGEQMLLKERLYGNYMKGSQKLPVTQYIVRYIIALGFASLTGTFSPRQSAVCYSLSGLVTWTRCTFAKPTTKSSSLKPLLLENQNKLFENILRRHLGSNWMYDFFWKMCNFSLIIMNFYWKITPFLSK